MRLCTCFTGSQCACLVELGLIVLQKPAWSVGPVSMLAVSITEGKREA